MNTPVRFLLALFLTSSMALHAAEELPNLRFNRFTVDDGLSQNTILSIAKDKYGFMWFATWEGANRFDGYQFKVFRADADTPGALPNNRVSVIVTDSTGNIWLKTGEESKLYRYDYATETFEGVPLKLAPTDVRGRISRFAVFRKRAGNERFTWTATEEGITRIDRRTGQTQRVQLNGDGDGRLNENVSCLYLDDADNLWVGLSYEGIMVANLKPKPFHNASGLSEQVVRAVSEDASGRLWVGTEANGIFVADAEGKRLLQRFPGDKRSGSASVRAMLRDRRNRMWIGTKNGLMCNSPGQGSTKTYRVGKTDNPQYDWIFCINEDRSGNIWVGTFGGLAKYDEQKDRFLYLKPKGLLVSSFVRAILEDERHRFWVGTEGGGLSCLQEAGNGSLHLLRHYRHELGNPNSLVNDLVLSLAEDEDKRIWIGTNGGLCRLDPSTGEFVRFSVSKGFPDDLIVGLLTDNKGNVWISHKKGLTCMNIRTFAMRNFSRSDGLQGNEFNQNAFYRNPVSGKMYFGGTQGLNVFRPELIRVDTIKPRPVLTVLKVMNQAVSPGQELNGKVVLKQSLLFGGLLRLPWEDRSFSIGFSSLNYVNPMGCRFRYRLRGADRDWNEVDASVREVNYAHLPAGTYRFEVFASNSDGLWSESPATLDIRVLPPWWLSIWAWLGYSLFLLTVFWFLYRFATARIEFKRNLLKEKLQNEKNEELMNLKLQFFTEISHEFRTPLTLIIDPLEQLYAGTVAKEKVADYYRLMQKNARQLLDLINQLLDFRKVQASKLLLNATSGDLVAFVREVAEAFTNKAVERNIRYVVFPKQETLVVDFDADKLRKVLNNLLSNAFRFTPNFGEISVRIELLSEETVQLEVCDNGSGIEEADRERIFDAFYQTESSRAQSFGSGIGLALVRELVLLHGGNITVSSEKGKGTCFTLLLPMHQNVVPVSVEAKVKVPLEAPSDDSVVSEVTTISSQQSDNIFTGADSVAVSAEKTASNSRPLLLFVDDQEDIRSYIRLNFGSEFEVITASDGLEAFNRAVEQIPNIVVSDVMMEGVDGFEFCRRLKSDERTSHIPVILLTARQTDESRIEGYELGADDYITKPFSTEVLTARVRNLLEQRRLLQKAYVQGSPLEIRKISVNVTDEVFLTKTVDFIEKNMEDPDFDSDRLAELLRMSRSQLYRKIKGLTNRSVHDFITTVRMDRALEWLLNGDLSISEVAYKVGFSIPSNFSRSFTKHFGQSPRKYLEKHKR